ncbi:MAG: hypothetical protein J4F41_09900, partial [Alphaproteobacteria bacterium]|nr:hypothetical protein [Alphaproteobacteria bacterium]
SESPTFSGGDALLPEEANGQTHADKITYDAITDPQNPRSGLLVGTLGGAPGFRLAAASSSNDNADFFLLDQLLYYIGTDSGDYEASPRDKLTVQILALNAQGNVIDNEAVDDNNADTPHDYVINLRNIDDLGPYWRLARGWQR